MRHTLKTEQGFFNAVARGTKQFEVRKDDRNPKFKVGDTLKLVQLGKDGLINGSWLQAKVSYILRDKRFNKKGFITMGIVVFSLNRK